MKITVPEPSLVVLAGPSGSGKSTFARRHFRPTEVISSDYCRGLVADDENDLSATGDAFDLLRYIASKRLAGRRLTVIDATSVKPEDRAGLIALAREFHLLAAAIVFDLPPQLCQRRNEERSDRDIGPDAVRRQSGALRRSLRGLRREGFHSVTVFATPEEADAAVIERQPLWPDRRGERGPFDIIGDAHGCFDELAGLLGSLGWEVGSGEAGPAARHPEGRKAVFLGDLVDRGPRSPEVLRLVMGMVEGGTALCVPGNHDVKLLRKLQGRDVKVSHGLAETLEQLEREPAGFAD
ncbi:MAG: AAA family ATPase, partial [Gemmatimonadetes bacterium]|nr:AAA family ATPase [Gemmatimonadota bacterium]